MIFTANFLSRTALAISIVATGLSAAAQAPTAFSTSNPTYVYVGAAGMNASNNPTKLFTTTDPQNPTFTGGTQVTGISGKLNGIGLNISDGFLYGISFPNTAGVDNTPFYRLGSNGATEMLGTLYSPTKTGATVSLINTTAGTVDAYGNYWFSAYIYTGNPAVTPWNYSNFFIFMGKVENISSLPPGNGMIPVTYYQIQYLTDLPIRTAIQSFLDNFNYQNPGSSDGGFEDLALRPSNGKFYTYISYPDPANPNQLLHRPAYMDPYDWTAHTVGTVENSTPNREIAGAWFDASDNFYVLFTDAQYSQVNLSTGALMGLMNSGLPTANNCNLRGDLASGFCNTVLPVVLEYFKGSSEATANMLTWKTGIETQRSSFILERSNDGLRFAPVGYVAMKGSNSTYTYRDVPGSAYYRLAIPNDENTGYDYSNTIRIINAQAGAPVRIFPTSTTDGRIQVNAPGEFSASLYDLNGKLIWTQRGASDASLMLTVAPGIYILRVADAAGKELAVQRIIQQ